MACHATIAASTATGQQERSISWPKTADTIAIYSRKSRYTGKGESIGNQIDLCREYIRTHYGDAAAEHAVVFEDEGFSAAT